MPKNDPQYQQDERESLTQEEAFDVVDVATDAKNLGNGGGVALLVWRDGELRCYVYEHRRAIE